MPLPAADARSIEEHIARVESRTGVQVVTMIAGKADDYPELPWIAFAIGVAVAALGVVVVDFIRPQWATASTAIVQSVAILCVGIACAAATLSSRGFARLLLSGVRAAAEVRQAAEAVFLSREMFATPDRTAILLYVSLFERHVELVPDSGFRSRIGKREWDGVVAAMTAELRAGRSVAAFHAGLDALERTLLGHGFTARAGAVNSIADRVVEGGAA
jgi:putative membrane protein